MFNFPLLKMIKATACEAYGRHCGSSGEYNHNVFNRPSNTLPVCETDASGNFGTGTLVDSNDDGDVEHVVNFEYQVQTTLSQTVARLNAPDSPLQAIERAISDAVVEGLFSGSQCTVPPVIKAGDNNNNTRRRQRQRYLQSYSDQLSGLRSEPADEVLPGSAGVTCQTDLVDAADRCYVIDAAFTLIGVNEDADFEWFEPRSLLEIKEAMERGEFNSIDPEIVDVQFVSGNVTLPERGTLPPNAIRDGGGGETIESDVAVTWPWLMLGVGVMVFFFAIFSMNKCAVQRKERIEAEHQSQAAALSSSASGTLAGVSSSGSTVSTLSSVQQTPQQTKKIKSKKQKILDTVPENQSGDASSVERDASSVESGHAMT